jgi:uncharacterized membrane protein YdjX (TVP38/TMEM64 family)
MGPWTALLCGLVGAQASALSGFALGHLLGKPLVRKLSPESVQDLSRRLADHGLLSVVLVRVVPVAPFVVVNLVAGASHLRFRIFNLGSLLGMAPGMFAVVLLASQVQAVITDPSGWAVAGLVLTAMAIAGALFFLRRALRSRRAGKGEGRRER